MRKSTKYSKTNDKNVRSDDADSRSEVIRKYSRRNPAPPTVNSCISTTVECNPLIPDMKLENGDQKCSFTLEDGGKMVKITRKNGDLIYMLRCADGKRVFIEKNEVGACLLMTNERGNITKSLAAQY
ncbi:unnamed protein product [Caenorhabditis angaria]|uniref:Uncharacterized protein n=1 Tax=Caenorhabditis angaria TaxID=860376 RepID=A0A9P1N1L8_9PELO|nr:unnamed protein product [Caenorhabditis angaria]